MVPPSITIFFADDDSEDVELFEEGLQEVFPNHIFYYQKDGCQVLSTVKEIKPDLIFLDYNMPKCSGFDCLKLIKDDPEIAQIPVIMYSTSSYKNHVAECYKFGAARFLLKPVDYAGVFKGLDVIRDLYEKALLAKPALDQFVIDTHKLLR